MIKHYTLQKPEDFEPGSDHVVSDDAIRRYIAKAIDDPYWSESDTKALIVDNDNTWSSPQTFGSIYGSWYVDGPDIDIMINEED